MVLERRVFTNFVVYQNQKAWMNQFIFQCERLSSFLGIRYKNKKFALLLDNATSHPKLRFDNIEFIFFPLIYILYSRSLL